MGTFQEGNQSNKFNEFAGKGASGSEGTNY